MRSPPPRVCCELATFAVLWKLARRHHQEITLSCSRQPRRRPQPAAHSELDTRMQHGRGPKHVACQVKHTHKKKKKKKSWVPHGADRAAAFIRTAWIRGPRPPLQCRPHPRYR